ncbi:MAG: polysaccharide biosynthesis/export family protein [Pseudomonadota bacterium]
MAHRTFPSLRSCGALFCAVMVLSACTLPRPGPTIQELAAEPEDGSPALEIIEITDQVSRQTIVDDALLFSQSFTTANIENIEVIRPLDVVEIVVWENTTPSLFGGVGGGTPLGPKQVDLSGRVFIPQVGRLNVSGLTVEELRQSLTRRLSEMTPEPQVEVSLSPAGGNTVKVFGSAGAIGEFPIQAQTRTLSGLLANTPGGGFDPEVSRITIRRGDLISSTWMEDVFRSPDADVPLQGGDVIIIENDPRSFIALGAVGSTSEVRFPNRQISLLDALALIGGLNAATADPTGVFVLRVEEEFILDEVAPDLSDEVERVAYVMDLTKPASFFVADGFMVRDGDIIYVSEAPYVQFLKVIGSIAPPLQAIDSTTRILDRTIGDF